MIKRSFNLVFFLGSFGNDKINGTTSGSNLIQLTGQNTSNNIDALQQAYAGLQQFAGDHFCFY